MGFIFNAVGITEPSIEKLRRISAKEFLLTSVTDMCEYYDVTCLCDRGKLSYCWKQMYDGKVPNFRLHKVNCVVCDCESEDQLRYLLEEYELPVDDRILAWIGDQAGIKFLGLTRIMLRQHLHPNQSERIEQVYQTVLFLRSIHDAPLFHQ